MHVLKLERLLLPDMTLRDLYEDRSRTAAEGAPAVPVEARDA